MTADNQAGGSTERIHSLDAYRGVLMLLGIVIHGAVPLLGYETEATEPASHGFVVWSLWFVHAFRMPAFFVLCGFFGALLWQRYGGPQMLMNRFERIILPLLVLLLLVMPFGDFVLSFFAPWFTGVEDPAAAAFNAATHHCFECSVEFHHLWFLYHLAWITFAAAWFVRWSRRREKNWDRTLSWVRKTFENPWRCVFVLGGLNILFCLPWGMTSVPAGTEVVPNPVFLLYYTLFYAFGWALFVSKADLSKSADRAWTLVVSGSVSVGAYAIMRDIYNAESFSLLEPEWMPLLNLSVVMFTWSFALFALTRGLMGLFYRYTSAQSDFWRYVSDSSYWVYIIHLIPAMGLPGVLHAMGLPILLNFVLTLILTTLIGFVSYDLFVRSTFIGRFLNGRRYERAGGYWGAAGLAVLLVLTSGYSLKVYDEAERKRKWSAQGGALSLLPLDLRPDANGFLRLAKYPQCHSFGPYAVCGDHVSWQQAAEKCSLMGGALVSFHDESVHQLVSRVMLTLREGSFWFDLNDKHKEGEWVDADGRRIEYGAWAPGQPDNYRGNEDCAHANWKPMKWNDVSCDARLAYVCVHDEGAASPVEDPICSPLIEAMSAWRMDPMREPESALAEAIRTQCVDIPNTSVSTLPSGTPLAEFAGSWTLDTEFSLESLASLEVTEDDRSYATQLLAALQPKVIFGAEQVSLAVQSWDGEQFTARPYVMKRLDSTNWQITVGEGDSATIARLAVNEGHIVVSRGERRWRLKRQ